MSHIAKGKGQVKTRKAIEAAVKALGGQVLEKKTYEWYGRHVGDYPLPEGYKKEQMGKCDFALKFPGIRYEVGVVKAPNGNYDLLYDFYGSGGQHDGQKLKAIVGDGCGTLIKEVTAFEMKARYQAKGYIVTSKQVGNQIKLSVSGF